MSPEQDARERAQLLHTLDLLICITSLPELPEIHLDSVQKWNGKRPEPKTKGQAAA
jgi:hypothetical protein